MSLATTLTIIACILLCVLPFVIINSRNKAADKKFLKILLDYASAKEAVISEYEMLRNQAIGISDITNHLFYLKRNKDDNRIQEIDLNKIDRCMMNKPTRSSVDGSYHTTGRIELQFVFSDKAKSDVVLELYNMERDGLTLNGELQLAQKWNSIINNRLEMSRN